MDLVKLRSLVTLADLGTIARTAEALSLSPPAIHKQLKALEAELDVVLYEKVGRQLRLTQAAGVLLPHARALLAQYEATLLAVEEWKGVGRGYVRIGTGPTFGSYVLPSLLQAYRARYPEVELVVDMATARDLAVSLGRGDLDVAFMAALDLLGTQDFQEIKRWPFAIPMVAHAGRPLPRPCPLSRLQEVPFVLYQKASLFDTLLTTHFARIGFRPNDVMHFNSAEMIKAVIRTDLGASMLPAWMIDGEVQRGVLRVIEPEAPPLRSDVTLAARRLSYQSHPVRAFIDMAERHAWPRSLTPPSA